MLYNLTKKGGEKMNANQTVNTLEKMLTIPEMIQHLIEKNIKFEFYSVADAMKYLSDNNSYENVTSYKNNFPVHQCGELKGKYIDLDFAYLIDLAIIDYRLRLLLFNMTTSIEHYLKLKISKLVESIPGEDGYNIVNLFLDEDYNDPQHPKLIHNSIMSKKTSEYYKATFLKYNLQEDKKIENLPLWEFLKIVSFGELIKFFKFFTDYYALNEKKYFFALNEARKLRNAVAHNVCILSNLFVKDNNSIPDRSVIKYLRNCGISKDIRHNKLCNSSIRQITYTLYLFNEIVTSDGIKQYVCEEINKLFYGRFILHKNYYVNNEQLKSVYNYFYKIISNNFKC